VAACGSSSDTTPGWMANADDSLSLARLSLPGTHDSAALYEAIPKSAKTQNLDIAQQLGIGVRFLDIRLRNVSDSLVVYHGIEDEMQTFEHVLATVDAYLDQHPSEAIVMAVKEETAAMDATKTFEQVFTTYVDKHWYTDPSLPTIGAARGKIVLVRRFDATAPLGIDASGWQDNTTFTLTSPAAVLRIEDNYLVTSNTTKWMQITTALTAARAAAPADVTLYVTFASGYMSTAGVPNLVSVSSAIDPMLETYLEDPAIVGAHLGIIAMDFVDGGHASHTIDANAL
jgi:1-phosphatidylinositol phosphodiesterase